MKTIALRLTLLAVTATLMAACSTVGESADPPMPCGCSPPPAADA